MRSRSYLSRLAFVVAVLLGVSTPLFLYSRFQAVPERAYSIGTDNTFPYHYLNGQGIPEGMAAEMINEAARRCGIRLHWELRREGPARALTSTAVDLWPLLGVQSQTLPNLHFSTPYLSNAYIALIAATRFPTPAGQRAIHRVAILGLPLVTRMARKAFPSADLLPYNSREDAFKSVCRGEADAIVVEARPAQHLILNQPPECEQKSFRTTGLELPPIQLAIAWRFGNVRSTVADTCQFLR